MKKHSLETSLPKWEKHIHLGSASACIVSSVDRSNEWGLAIQWTTVGKCKYCKWKWLQCRHFLNMFWCCQLVHRCFTSVSVVGCWLMNHVIYLKLRQNNCCYKLSKSTLFTQNGQVWKEIIILSENSFHLFSFWQELSLSQLEINHVIYEPTANNWHRCRAP